MEKAAAAAAAIFILAVVFVYATSMVQCSSNISIFLLGGQSNMVGYGGVKYVDKVTFVWDGLVPPESTPNPRILRLNNDSFWEEAREPLHFGIGAPQPCGIGPGMPFANSILKPGEVIGLVPCAVGNTYIFQWKRGSFNYNRMLDRARAALSTGGLIRALLWYQGENDTYDEEDAESYGRHLLQLFNDVRNDLNSPSLPIIVVALKSGGVYKEKVRKGQFETAAELENVYCVDAQRSDLRLQDALHLNTSAQATLGAKYLADAFNKYIANSV